MRISLIRPAELGSSEIQAWHSMQLETSSLVNPFLCPEYSMGVGGVQSAARVAVLTEGSRTLGFFPFERRRFGVGAAIGAGLSNCQGLIHAPDVEWDARALLKACGLSTWQFNRLTYDQKPFERYGTDQVRSALVDLSEGYESYDENFRLKSPKFLKSMNRKIRSLEKDFGEIRLVTDARDVADLRLFMSWKSDQFERNGWLDIFARPWVVDLIDHLFATRTDFFSCALSMLYAGETPIASALDFRSRHCLVGWHCAYNPEFGKYSPGSIRYLFAVKKLADAGIQLYELGDESYQERFKNSDACFTKGTVTAGSLAASVHRAQSVSSSYARRTIKRFPFAYRVADGVLQRMGKIA
jgi:CelD/BcsL family acetyltransferase involved in cellulose biosynthesis